jgi:hypothetical protein
MGIEAILTIVGGVALLVGIFGGGVKAKEIEVPPIHTGLRVVSALTGIVLIVIAIFLSKPELLQVIRQTQQPSTPVSGDATLPPVTLVAQSPTTVQSQPTATQLPTEAPTPTKTIEPTPTLDPSCDNRMEPVREPAAQGDQRTYTRCPVGQVQYSIQVDDFLNSIVLDCPSKAQQTITFEKNEQRSKDQLLQTFDSEKFTSQPGCRVKITITNGVGEMGYTIWQEVVGP